MRYLLVVSEQPLLQLLDGCQRGCEGALGRINPTSAFLWAGGGEQPSSAQGQAHSFQVRDTKRGSC